DHSATSSSPTGSTSMAWWTSSSLALVVFVPALASADPIRLRGDALATVQAPAGLMTLEAAGRGQPWLDGEASVWFGAGDDTQANALVVAVRIKDPKRRGSLRLGRQVVTVGALRPLHLDGAYSIVRLPDRMSLEGFGGIPVEPSLARSWDWATGT